MMQFVSVKVFVKDTNTPHKTERTSNESNFHKYEIPTIHVATFTLAFVI